MVGLGKWFDVYGSSLESRSEKKAKVRVKRVSDDSILGQLIQLQVVEGLPGADDCDICREKRHRLHRAQVKY